MSQLLMDLNPDGWTGPASWQMLYGLEITLEKDTSTGQLVAEVMELNITTIIPVNKLHPRDDIMASGSSQLIFIWRQMENVEPAQGKDERKYKVSICEKDDKKFRKKLGDGSDDDSDDFPKGKKLNDSRPKKHGSKSTRSVLTKVNK